MPKAKLTDKDLWVEMVDVGYGCRQALAWKRGWFAPVGVVWFNAVNRDGGTLVQTLHSYVPEPYRRQGIRTVMHNAIAAAYKNPLFVTGDDSTYEGSAWMTGMGFEWLHGQMVLQPKKPAEKKAAKAKRK